MSDVSSVISGFGGGALGGSGAALFVFKAIQERWLTAAKAKLDRELERLKDELAQGSYISRASFDVELNAYKELWLSLSNLRNQARSMLFQHKVDLSGLIGAKEENFRISAFLEGFANFREAHNDAVMATDKYGPFITQAIKSSARLVTSEDMAIINHCLTRRGEEMLRTWFETLDEKVAAVDVLIAKSEDLIRRRMSEVRIIQ